MFAKLNNASVPRCSIPTASWQIQPGARISCNDSAQNDWRVTSACLTVAIQVASVRFSEHVDACVHGYAQPVCSTKCTGGVRHVTAAHTIALATTSRCSIDKALLANPGCCSQMSLTSRVCMPVLCWCAAWCRSAYGQGHCN